jgi:hypothetical protein
MRSGRISSPRVMHPRLLHLFLRARQRQIPNRLKRRDMRQRIPAMTCVGLRT